MLLHFFLATAMACLLGVLFIVVGNLLKQVESIAILLGVDLNDQSKAVQQKKIFDLIRTLGNIFLVFGLLILLAAVNYFFILIPWSNLF